MAPGIARSPWIVLSLALSAPFPGISAGASWAVYETARDNGHRMARLPDDAPGLPAAAGAADPIAVER